MRSSFVRGTALAFALAGAITLSGCSTPVIPSPATPSAGSGSPSSSSDFDMPQGSVPGQVAFAQVDSVSSMPTNGSTVGPGLLVRGRSFVIEGGCVGPSGGRFRLTTAEVSSAPRTLTEGELACGQAVRDQTSGVSDFSGPVQLAFISTDGIELGWLRVIQEPAG
ncbi:hypothetical protein [Leifsonia poae]|nr:hypothetical protein [Leifsonia poae]